MYSNKNYICIIFFVLLLLTAFWSKPPINNIKSHDGVINLQGVDFNEKTVVELSGQWAYYQGIFAFPEDFEEDFFTKSKELVDIPMVWDALTAYTKDKPGNFYGTFRLNVEFDKTITQPLSLKLNGIMTNYRVFINGKSYGAVGIPGRTEKTSTPDTTTKIITFIPDSNKVEIVLQVSNFHHYIGGISDHLLLGSKDAITSLRERNISFEFFLFGAIIMMALYHLGIFLSNKFGTSPLYFAMFSSLIALRIIVMGEKIFLTLFSFCSYDVLIKLEYLTFYAGFPIFLLYIQSLYEDTCNKKINIFYYTTSAIFISLIILFKVSVFTCSLPFFQAITFSGIIYVFYVLSKAVKKREEGAGLFLFFITLFCIAVISDILYINGLIEVGPFTPFAFFIFIFFQAFLLLKKFVASFDKVEHLAIKNKAISSELKELNTDLEKKIDERTAELKIKNEKLAELAVTDGLTGLYNHKHSYERLDVEIGRAKRYNTNLTIGMFDIDHFKSVNDTYGHQTGDEVLKIVADCISSSIRDIDVAGRYGGEEFIFIMTNSDKKGTMVCFERIRKKVEALTFSEENLKVTISCGLAEFNTETAAELINIADQRLYIAKESGRNRIVDNG